jgi:stage II sporulation protein D
MSPPKHNSKTFAAIVALSLIAALCSACARPSVTAEDAGGAEKKKSASADDIDRALTAAATEALGDREGAVLVMDPHTGRLRTVVNPRLAFEQAFPPGSTIKSFTALTALRAGLIDYESRTLCRERFTRDGFQVTCSHPKSNSPFNVKQALAYSCNYFFATLGERSSFQALKSTLASAGFGKRTGVNAGGESAGALREDEWPVRDLLGEGNNLLVTPIQLLNAYCGLVNGGQLNRPQLAPADKFVSDEQSRLHIDDSHRAALIEGMRGAVVYGTAEKAGLASLPVFVFGKTGTSTASNGFRRQGWFVSFAADATSSAEATPDKLELAVLVFIKRSHGSDAAAVSKRIFEEYAKQSGEKEPEGKRNEERARRGDAETPRRGTPSPHVRVKMLSEGRVVTLPLEDYVAGVLSVEAAVEDEAEALKAQAIVSRTFALKNLGRHSSEGFDLCSNTHCQQYMNAAGRASERFRRAVAETAGEVLRDSRGQLADSYFHSACGGSTANIESLWGVPAPGYLRGVRDDYCTSMPNHDWTDEIPALRLTRALAGDPRTDAGRRIDNIIITKKDATGRAEIISIEGERRRRVGGWEFKLVVGRALGWNVLKSSRFSVSRQGSTFIFRGSGFGHGLGLCQNGSHVMARRGAVYTDILKNYFPGTTVDRPMTAEGRTTTGDRRPTTASLRFCTYMTESSVIGGHRSSVNGRRLAGGGRQAVVPHKSLSSEHFRVSYYARLERVEVEAALRTLEAARVDMLARVGPASLSLPAAAIDVVVQETTQAFIAVTGQPWWVAGVTRGRRIDLQPFAVLRRRRILNSTLRHEYAHAVIEVIGQGRTLRWLAEGLAIGFAGEGPSLERFRPKARLSLEELERALARPGSAAEMRSFYAAAYSEVRALIRAEGEPSVWRRIAPMRALTQAAEKVILS